MERGIKAQKKAALRSGIFLFCAPFLALFLITLIIFGLKPYISNEASIRNAEYMRRAAPFTEAFFENIYKSAFIFFESAQRQGGETSKIDSALFFEINSNILALAEYNEMGNVNYFFVNESIPKASNVYSQIENLVKERATEFNPLPFNKTILFQAEFLGRPAFVLRFITREKTPAMAIISSEELSAAFSNESIVTLLYGGEEAQNLIFSSALNKDNKSSTAESIRAERALNINYAGFPLSLKIVTLIPTEAALGVFEKIKRVNIAIALTMAFFSFFAAWILARFVVKVKLKEESSEISVPKNVERNQEEFFIENDIKIELPSSDVIFTKKASVLFFNLDNFYEAGGTLDGEEAVSLLKDCVKRAASFIALAGGEIEALTGTGILAQFGLSATKNEPHSDALNALCAAMLIRACFKSINDKRKAFNLPQLRAVCAISAGDVSRGKTSDGRTLLQGAAASFAGRAASRISPYGADILINEEAMRLAGRYFYTCEMPPCAQERLFAIVNVKDALTKKKLLSLYASYADNEEEAASVFSAESPRTMVQMRRALGIKTPDLRPFAPKKTELHIVKA